MFLWKLTLKWEDEAWRNKGKHVPPQKISETNELKQRLTLLTRKVYFELIEHLTHLEHIQAELLNFTLVFLYFISNSKI